MSTVIQEFLVISPRGDTLIAKSYAGTVQRSTADTFLRLVKKGGREGGTKGGGGVPPPVFQIEGLTFCYVQTNSMYFVVTTLTNCQAAVLIELLQRLSRVFKDYLGVLTEESVRRNFLLLYELLDEVFDSGVPQGMSTELLKAYVYNDPVAVSATTGLVGSVASAGGGMSGKLEQLAHGLSEKVNLGEKKTMTSAAANKPIQVSGDKKDNTIFVDVIERLTVVLDSRGSMTHSYINGCITLKSFMTGSSEMRLGLSDGVSVTSLGISGKGASAVNTLVMEDMNLHECVRWDENKKEPVFTFFAPDGEFNLLNYRIKSPFRAPISVVPFLETKPRANSLDYVLRVRGEFPADKTAAHVSLVFALPHWANSVAVETASATAAAQAGEKGAVPVAGKAQFDRKTQVVSWQIAKIQGGTEVIVRCKIVLASNMDATTCSLEDFGVVRVNFELPMYLLSGVSIKFLDFLYSSGKTPNKWIRYVTQANSYVARWS